MRQLILNFQNDSEATGGMMTSSSRVASHNHASHTQQQVSDLGKQMKDISFQKCLEQLKKSNPDGLLAKMFVDLLAGMEGWYSTRCTMIWKGKDMKCNRFLFQLQVSTHRTKDIEFGLLPTPQAMDIRTDVRKPEERSEAANQGGCSNLRDWAANGMLPTPSAFDWNTAQTQEKYQERKQMQKENGINLHYPLKQMAMDINPTGKTSQLNPLFVIEMMGFPPNWTELPFLNGETNQLKQQGTL
jgi:hypothetical protein